VSICVHPRATDVRPGNPIRWTHKQLIALRSETLALEMQGVRLPVKPNHNPRIAGICKTCASIKKPAPLIQLEGLELFNAVAEALWEEQFQ
jgi:hypothetical protein